MKNLHKLKVFFAIIVSIGCLSVATTVEAVSTEIGAKSLTSFTDLHLGSETMTNIHVESVRRDLFGNGAGDYLLLSEARTASPMKDDGKERANREEGRSARRRDFREGHIERNIDTYTKGEPLLVIMSPYGNDRNNGVARNAPILTLERAQEVIRGLVPDRNRDVEVRIESGTYRNQTVRWTFTMPEHTITFMPINNDKKRPVFDGRSTKGATWFRLDHAGGEKTNLVFHYIRVENYTMAIDLHGNRNKGQGFNSTNRIYGSYFKNIGEDSTAAVALVNSKNNQVINNHFIDVLSRRDCGKLHALYIAHMSSGNEILRNYFKNSCGDPIRIRDYSNDNIINNNTLIKVGIYAAYTDWYCDNDARNDCSKPRPECPSYNNQFRNNVLDRNHRGKKLKVFRYFQDEQTTGCAPPSPTSRRLRTSGNVHK